MRSNEFSFQVDKKRIEHDEERESGLRHMQIKCEWAALPRRPQRSYWRLLYFDYSYNNNKDEVPIFWKHLLVECTSLSPQFACMQMRRDLRFFGITLTPFTFKIHPFLWFCQINLQKFIWESRKNRRRGRSFKFLF